MPGRYAQHTEVSGGRSKDEVERTLVRFGATEFIYGRTDNYVAVGFRYERRAYRLQVPMPTLQECRTSPAGRARTESSAENAWHQERRRRWRVLCAYIKALVVGVEEGVLSWEEALLPYALLQTGSRVADELLPRMEQALEAGKLDVKLLPGLRETG